MARAAREAGTAVTGDFERLRSGADEESARTAAAVRSAIEAASAKMMESFTAASGQFGDSVARMNAMAAEIRRELDATRADLQRGVLDLPRETQDATSEMRRVVAEQIDALNELAALVARSNRSVDVAQPAAQARAVEQRRTAEAGRAASAPIPASIPAPQPAPAPARSAAPTASRPQASAPSAAPARPASPAAAQGGGQGAVQGTAQGAVQGRPGTRDNRGWLSDLLTRASIDDDGAEAAPAPAPAPAPEAKGPVERISLDAISTDIARMVDHQASVEFWQRYRRGDANLFDGRLYTAQGRQTFEQIQRRYRADAEFRRTVDRYVGEFERLLGEVTKNDRDTKRADAYLTSETGKVYTMLAHASGRFDEA
ncbi:hypothetical protein CHKEEEPN_4438 [Methylorubrum podarium]|nr:hypothetical protein CHKEEEPN_4438 [Methylorubrum podarium]